MPNASGRAFSIAYVLSQRRKLSCTVPTHDGIEDLQPVAPAAIRHLELCGYTITERAPRPWHSTHGRG